MEDSPRENKEIKVMTNISFICDIMVKKFLEGLFNASCMNCTRLKNSSSYQ